MNINIPVKKIKFKLIYSSIFYIEFTILTEYQQRVFKLRTISSSMKKYIIDNCNTILQKKQTIMKIKISNINFEGILSMKNKKRHV